MPCGHCGATISPDDDRCSVCATPVSPSSAPVLNPAATARDPHVPSPAAADVTRLSNFSSTSGVPTGISPATTARDLHVPSAAAAEGVTRLADPGSMSRRGASGGGSSFLEAGQKFGSRYTIIQALGAGGMAAVYQAWDETLSTAVALKLIRFDVRAAESEIRDLEERFKRELKLARQVTHPNVVRIHDLGQLDDTLYITMEYIRGGDLATLLRREPRLPTPRALNLARQIAAGLAAAHRVGIVHRDLKPANIMIDAEDHALLMDFGIARSTTSATMHTMAGALIGTLDYMAPEQARGQVADERTDVYGFGLILYELLAGGRPSSSIDGGLSGLIARLERGPAPLRGVAPDVPVDLERVVNKCLASDPAARYLNAGEVLADLEALDNDGRARADERAAGALLEAAGCDPHRRRIAGGRNLVGGVSTGASGTSRRTRTGSGADRRLRESGAGAGLRRIAGAGAQYCDGGGAVHHGVSQGGRLGAGARPETR